MHRFVFYFVCVFILVSLSASCNRPQPLDPDSLRGLSLETLQEMREDILAQHEDGSELSPVETANVELLREQERRLENSWVFGEWRERHGARLLFRDDGTVSVGARGGEYDELGIYKYVSPEIPAYESTWSVAFDEAGDPVILVDGQADGEGLLYAFHKSRKEVYEQAGDLQTAAETGYYFTKM